jgi:hypothetical protein
MTLRPIDDSPTVPFWRVQNVFDPDGNGKDFAYTVGLFTRGFPELHLWGRPSLGEDPGEDWMLGVHDRCVVLNELAELLVSGSLHVGDEVRREYDGGHAVVTFRVEEPGDRHDLEAFAAAPGALVLPVRWSLSRPPEGAPAPVAGGAREAALATYDEILRRLDRRRTPPVGWELPDEPDFAIDQRFGPLTPVVLGRAAQLWSADDDTLIDLLHAEATLSYGHSTTTAISVAIALGREAGRRKQLEDLRAASEQLVHHLTTGPAGRHRWRAVVRAADPAFWDSLDRDGRRRIERNCAGLLREAVTTCLMVEAVADVADPSLLLEGRGPWLSAQRHERLLSHPDWRASAPVLQAVRAVLQPLDARTLTTVAGIHQIALDGVVEGATRYGEVCARLQSWALVSAVGCPWEVLATLPGWEPLLCGLPGASIGEMPQLRDLATCLTTALSHRARLSSDDVRTLALPYKIDCPDLEEVLNTPM